MITTVSVLILFLWILNGTKPFDAADRDLTTLHVSPPAEPAARRREASTPVEAFNCPNKHLSVALGTLQRTSTVRSLTYSNDTALKSFLDSSGQRQLHLFTIGRVSGPFSTKILVIKDTGPSPPAQHHSKCFRYVHTSSLAQAALKTSQLYFQKDAPTKSTDLTKDKIQLQALKNAICNNTEEACTNIFDIRAANTLNTGKECCAQHSQGSEHLTLGAVLESNEHHSHQTGSFIYHLKQVCLLVHPICLTPLYTTELCAQNATPLSTVRARKNGGHQSPALRLADASSQVGGMSYVTHKHQSSSNNGSVASGGLVNVIPSCTRAVHESNVHEGHQTGSSKPLLQTRQYWFNWNLEDNVACYSMDQLYDFHLRLLIRAWEIRTAMHGTLNDRCSVYSSPHNRLDTYWIHHNHHPSASILMSQLVFATTSTYVVQSSHTTGKVSPILNNLDSVSTYSSFPYYLIVNLCNLCAVKTKGEVSPGVCTCGSLLDGSSLLYEIAVYLYVVMMLSYALVGAIPYFKLILTASWLCLSYLVYNAWVMMLHMVGLVALMSGAIALGQLAPFLLLVCPRKAWHGSNGFLWMGTSHTRACMRHRRVRLTYARQPDTLRKTVHDAYEVGIDVTIVVARIAWGLSPLMLRMLVLITDLGYGTELWDLDCFMILTKLSYHTITTLWSYSTSICWNHDKRTLTRHGSKVTRDRDTDDTCRNAPNTKRGMNLPTRCAFKRHTHATNLSVMNAPSFKGGGRTTRNKGKQTTHTRVGMHSTHCNEAVHASSITKYSSVSVPYKTVLLDGTLYQVYTIQGDGNCSVRALSFALFGTQDKHMATRRKLAQGVVDNWDKFEHKIAMDGEPNTMYSDSRIYYNNRIKDGVWLESYEMEPLAYYFNVCIRVWSWAGEAYKCFNQFNHTGDTDIHILHVNNNHFEVAMNSPATPEFISMNEAVLHSRTPMGYHRAEVADPHPTTPGKGDTPDNGIPVYTPSPLGACSKDMSETGKRVMSSPMSDYENLRWHRKKARQYRLTSPMHTPMNVNNNRDRGTPTGSTPEAKRWEDQPPMDKPKARKHDSPTGDTPPSKREATQEPLLAQGPLRRSGRKVTQKLFQDPMPRPLAVKKTRLKKVLDKVTGATSAITEGWRAWLSKPKEAVPTTNRHTIQTRLWPVQRARIETQDKEDNLTTPQVEQREHPGIPANDDCITLLTWNVQTLDNKRQDVQELIEAHSPDILTLTETKHYRSNTLKHLLPQHIRKQYSHYSTPVAKEAGVVLLVKKRLESKAMALTSATFRSNACTVRLQLSQHRFVSITGIYHRPWEPQDDAVWEWMDRQHSDSECIVMGDFNLHYDLADTHDHSFTNADRSYHVQLQRLKLKPANVDSRTHTFYSSTMQSVSSRIDDVLYTRSWGNITKCETVIDTESTSDHEPLLVKMQNVVGPLEADNCDATVRPPVYKLLGLDKARLLEIETYVHTMYSDKYIPLLKQLTSLRLYQPSLSAADAKERFAPLHKALYELLQTSYEDVLRMFGTKVGETHRYTKRQVNKAGVKLRKELKEVKRRVNKYTEYMSKYEGHPRHLDYETITGEKYTGQEDSAQWYEAMKTRLLAVRREVGRLHTQHRNEQIQIETR